MRDEVGRVEEPSVSSGSAWCVEEVWLSWRVDSMKKEL